jgi:hypothetical protein
MTTKCPKCGYNNHILYSHVKGGNLVRSLRVVGVNQKPLQPLYNSRMGGRK